MTLSLGLISFVKLFSSPPCFQESHAFLATMSLSSSDPAAPAAQQHQSVTVATSFPRFSALPPEIRIHIWRAVAPVDPRRGPQVLAFEMCGPDGRKGRMSVRPCPSLVRQTAGVRAVLAVHQESRAEAVRAFPHVLGRYDSDRIVVRFDAERDVVLLDRPHDSSSSSSTSASASSSSRQDEGRGGPEISGVFSRQIRQLAVGPRFFDFYRLSLKHPQSLMRFLKPFNRLTVVYYALDASVLEEASGSWCTSAGVHHFYQAETDEGNRKSPSRRQEVLYCWPDLVRHRKYAEQEPSLREADFAASPRLQDLLELISGAMPPPRTGDPIHTVRADSAYLYLSDEDVRRLEAVEYWPMVAFAGFSSIRRYRSLGGIDVEKHPDDSDSE